MSKGKEWLRLRAAAQLVKRTFRLRALGEARLILCMAGDDQEQRVRTCGAEGVREWAEIDLENELLRDGFGERWHCNVMLNKADLRVWLARNPDLKPVDTSAPQTSRRPKSVRVRPAREKPFWPGARIAAFEWFAERGFPAPGDGGQARLEAHIADWLAERGHGAAESTIRMHVRKWIDEYEANPEKAG